MRKEKGITLLALVVTIVILIILATVSINIVSKDGGVLTKAEQAKYVYEMSEVQQRIDMALLEVKTKNKGKAPVDKFIEHLKEREIIEPDSVVENSDGSIEATTPDGWVVKIEKEEDGKYVKSAEIEGKTNNLSVKITSIQLIPTTHDITVKVTASRGEKAKYSYYYKQGAITDEEKGLSGDELVKNHGWIRAEEKTDSLEVTIGDNIEQAKQYTVMVEAIEENVVKARGYATASTTDVPIATGAITFGELSWESGLAKVTVSKTTEEYYLQYQIVNQGEMPVDSEWKTLPDKTTNEVEVKDIDLGKTVVARLWDGYKGGASISSIEVKDEIAPQLEITKTESTTNSITVTILATDAESGMGESPTYKFYIKEKDGEYGNAQEDTKLSHTFEGLNQETEYIVKVEVSDRAGNVQTKEKLDAIKTETIPDAGDGKTTGAITFGDLSWPNKKASVSITKNTTEYQLQWKKVTTGTKAEDIGESGWTLISNKETNTTTATDIDLNETVVARLWDGRQGGKIASIDIKDGVNPSATINLNGKTTINEGEAINATVTHSDGESGINIGKCKWILNTQSTELGTADDSYTGTFTKESESLTPTISKEGTYYLHVLSVDRTGTNKKETISGAITVKKPSATLAELVKSGKVKAGDYIAYSPGTGTSTSNGTFTVSQTLTGYNQDFSGDVKSYTGAWRVLSIDSTKTPPVIEIVSVDNVEDRFPLGTKTGYNGAVEALNSFCSHYVNPSWALSARSVGSNPDNVNGTTTNYAYTGTDSYIKSNATGYKASDNNYLIDQKKLQAIDEISKGYGFWYASRGVYEFNQPLDSWQTTDAGIAFTVYYEKGKYDPLFSIDLLNYRVCLERISSVWKSIDQGAGYHGVRPVVKLKSDILIDLSNASKSGSSADNAWVIK